MPYEWELSYHQHMKAWALLAPNIHCHIRANMLYYCVEWRRLLCRHPARQGAAHAFSSPLLLRPLLWDRLGFLWIHTLVVLCLRCWSLECCFTLESHQDRVSTFCAQHPPPPVFKVLTYTLVLFIAALLSPQEIKAGGWREVSCEKVIKP